MGRKSRTKKQRRLAGVPSRQAAERAATRRGSAAEQALVELAAAADPGPHPLLPERLLPRRCELRDRAAAGPAWIWAAADFLGRTTGTGGAAPLQPDPDRDALHELDAQVAWEELLRAADRDPTGAPDPGLCQVVADCLPVDRGEDLDPLMGGLWTVTMDLVDRLNAVSSPDGDAEQCTARLAQVAEVVTDRLGDQARSMLDYLAAEATEHYRYPAGSWPTSGDLPGEPDDCEPALGTWVREKGIERTAAVVLAARMAPVLAELEWAGDCAPAR
jgi:hypothetical protein